MRTLAILGASGHGRVAADIALQSGWDDIVFFDDNVAGRKNFEHWRFAGDTHTLFDSDGQYTGLFIAIGNSKVRKAKLTELAAYKTPIATLIHPKAVVSPFASIGEGSIVVAGAVINAFAKIGRGCIINTGATVGHDCQLDECVHIAPGANIAGDVKIGQLTWIGIGSAIRQGITVGSNVTLGAGAALVRNAKDGEVLVGVPARPQ